MNTIHTNHAIEYSPTPLNRFKKLLKPGFTGLLAFTLCMVSALLQSADDKELQERQKLVGVWQGFAVEGRGDHPDRGPVKLELRITEKTMKGLEFKGTNAVDHGVGEFILDLNQNPAHLDAWQTNERGRKTSYVGIYTVDSSTLKWCVSPRKTRPAEFRTGDGGFLLILKRQQPK